MKTVSSELGTTTLAVCWRIERTDEELILGTEHDRNVTILTGPLAGTYLARTGITGSDVRSTSDLSVDNLEVQAFQSSDVTILGLRAADVEAGLFDSAEVTLFLANWQNQAATPLVIRKGTLGAISRTAEGQYKSELRGLTQKLSQSLLRTYSVTCDADLYDTRCKVVRASFTFIGTVISVTSRKMFVVDFGSPDAPVGFLNYGEVLFTSGENSGYRKEIVENDSSGILLFESMPKDVQVGDTLEAYAGCDKLKATCIDKFNNLVNFRGHGFHVPGMTEILKVGGQDA